MSKGTVYLYFLTKEDLFRAVVRQGLLPNLAAMEAAGITAVIAAAVAAASSPARWPVP